MCNTNVNTWLYSCFWFVTILHLLYHSYHYHNIFPDLTTWYGNKYCLTCTCSFPFVSTSMGWRKCSWGRFWFCLLVRALLISSCVPAWASACKCIKYVWNYFHYITSIGCILYLFLSQSFKIHLINIFLIF